MALHTFLVIGYVYRSETYCDGECIVNRLITEGRLAPAALDMTAEEALDALAEAEALDDIERRDSDTYPQAVFGAQDDLMGEVCAGCHGEIDPAPEYMGRNAHGEWVERCACGSTEHTDDAPESWHLPA